MLTKLTELHNALLHMRMPKEDKQMLIHLCQEADDEHNAVVREHCKHLTDLEIDYADLQQRQQEELQRAAQANVVGQSRKPARPLQEYFRQEEGQTGGLTMELFSSMMHERVLVDGQYFDADQHRLVNGGYVQLAMLLHELFDEHKDMVRPQALGSTWREFWCALGEAFGLNISGHSASSALNRLPYTPA